MLPQSPSSSDTAATAADTTTSEPAAPEIYSAAQLRAEALERTGRTNMGEFMPRGRAPAAPEPEFDAEEAAASAESGQAPAPQGGDVAAELAAMRAEVAALQRQAQPEPEPTAEPAAEPAKPAHPLEAHARTVLGPGAQPKHVARAVTLLEQAMQWDAFARHHEANPSEASGAELARAKRARAEIDRELDGLSELAQLHAQQAELRAELAKSKAPDPEQQKRERSESLTAKIFTPEAMGRYHPNLWAAMQGLPAMRKLVHEQLMALPYDAQFAARGDAILHALEAECTPAEPPAKPAAAPVAPAPHARTIKAPPPRPPAPTPPAEQPVLTREQWRRQLANNFEARSRS